MNIFIRGGEYLMSIYILISLKKLENSKDKQFIVALSTNNHPPYNIPNDYESKKMEYSKEIKNHITGNFDLAKQRFKSYAYAVDQVGVF